jgi:class 3 adenylate cyclase
VATQLNRFYQLASNAIFRHDGTLDKLVGDQVMAFFGAPIHREDHPRRAVETAVEIMREIVILTDQLGLRVGAGISTGEAFVGNVGGSEVTDYTVLGDTAPRAASCCSKARANRSSPGRLPDHRRRLSSDHRFGRWNGARVNRLRRFAPAHGYDRLRLTGAHAVA